MTTKLPIVAVDVRDAAGQRAGKGNVAYYLMEELLKRDLPWQFDLYSKTKIEDLTVRPPHQARLIGGWPGLRMLWLAREISRSRAAISIFPTGYQVAVLLALLGRPYILIVHDLVAFTPYRRLLATGTRIAEQTLLPLAARHAARILTVSAFTKGELLRTVPKLKAAKIEVMHLAPHPRFSKQLSPAALATLRARYELPDQFLLFIGTLEPRKNIHGMLRAYHQLPKRLKDTYPFILVGKSGWLEKSFPDLQAELAPGDPIRHIPYIEMRDLAGFYQAATALFYPSLYEGFGLPPLEAMASGCPVVVSAAGSLPEVVGETGLIVDPTSPDDMARGLARLFTEPALRERLSVLGRQRAQVFTWQKAADVFRTVVDEELGAGQKRHAS